MDGNLDDLDGCKIASLDLSVFWQRDLREADGAWIRAVGWAEDLYRRKHGV